MLTGKLVAGGVIACAPGYDMDGKKTDPSYYFTQFSFTLDPDEITALGLSAESLGSCLKELEKMGDFEEIRKQLHHRDGQGWQNYGLEVKCPANPLITVSLTPESDGSKPWEKYHILASFFMRTENGEMATPERELTSTEVLAKEIDSKEKKEVKESLEEGRMKDLVMETGEPDGNYDVDSFKAIEKALKEKGIEAKHKEFDKYQGVFMNLSKDGKSAKYWHTDTYFTGATKSPKGKFKDAYMIGDDGEKYSANSGDYFMQKKDHVFKGSTLVTVSHDGETKEIKDPKKSDLPDMLDVSSGVEFDGQPDMVMAFTLEGDDEPIEIKIADGKADVTNMVNQFEGLAESVNGSEFSESLDIFGLPI